jgi:glycosyltransferase involved in cell wall biosynthesis
VFYAADTNVVELAQSPARTLARRFACAAIAKRATAAQSLGFTNRLALQALGFHRTVDLPAYAVDFAALDAAAKVAGGGASDRYEDKIVVLIVARLTPVKNLPAFVRAFAAQKELAKLMRLVIVGEGPDREALQEIQRHTPSLPMELLGPVPRREIGAIFRRADVLVLPSLVEPWGIVVVEALGMGLPVIATPAVGAAVSLAGYAGAVLISEDTDPQSVMACLRRYMDKRHALAAIARDDMPHIRQHFDRVEVAKATIRLVYGDCPSPTVSGPC